jgi:GNAT superfamily N-acetyltransferase
MSVIIRNATEFDASALLGLWNELMNFHEQLDPLFRQRENAHKAWLKFVRENIEKETALVVVAEQNKQLVGYSQALITPYPPVFKKECFGELLDMAVSPHVHRQGIGTLLFEKIRRWYRQQGIDRIEVRAHVRNPISNPFWSKLGFQRYLTTYAMEI